MKILHTADWHIGKVVDGVNMIEDQSYLLKQFVDLVAAEKPDVIIIAGDLYDRAIPPVEAIELLDELLSEILLDLNIPVLIVAGNHDSPDRVGFASHILKERGLHIAGRLTKDIEPITFQDAAGPVNFYLVPYADPAIVRHIYDNPEISNHDDAMKTILDKIKEEADFQERNVLVTHAFVTGVECLITSESERFLSIGGTEYVDVNYFKEFNYTALGHLHRPQKVYWEKVRYSGSLLKYSFSEHNQKKSLSLIEMDAQGEVEIREISLEPIRDMRKISGKLEKLLDPQIYGNTNVDDYLMVTVEDEGEIIDLIDKLRTVYSNVLSVARQSFAKEDDRPVLAKDFAKKNTLELFSDFYCSLVEQEFTEKKKEIVASVINEIEEEGRN